MAIASISMMKLRDGISLDTLLPFLKKQIMHLMDVYPEFIGTDIFLSTSGGNLVLITKWTKEIMWHINMNSSRSNEFFYEIDNLIEGFGVDRYHLISYVRSSKPQTLETVTSR